MLSTPMQYLDSLDIDFTGPGAGKWCTALLRKPYGQSQRTREVLGAASDGR